MALSGTITLADSTVLNITDENLVANSLSIQMSVCQSTYAFGTFNAATMTIGVIDDDSTDHNFAGAEIELNLAEDGNTLYLGKYYVDGEKTKRRAKQVTLQAMDATGKFDVEIASSFRTTSYTAETALAAICTAVGVTLATSSLSGFCNTSITFKADNIAIQTYRDYIMWICQLLAAHAVLNRDGELEIRHARYITDTADKTSTGSERTKIEFSDRRMYVEYMTAYSAGKTKTYHNTHVFQDTSATGGMINLPWNPLTDSMTETQCDTINEAILADIATFLQRKITALVLNDPTMFLDEIVRFSGGRIDVRRSIVGMVTSITWKHHGYTQIQCASMPEAKG